MHAPRGQRAPRRRPLTRAPGGLAPALALLALAACGPAAAPPPPPPDDVVTASCAAPPAHDLLGTTETEPGWDEALAALDLDALPAQIDTSGLSALSRDLVAYMLETPPAELVAVDRDAARRTPLGEAVLGAFASAAADGSAGVDVAFLRRGLFARYACARRQPVRLEDFLADFTPDATEALARSIPKARPRRLTHGTDAAGHDVYLGETLLDDGSVRETEALVHGARADGAVDFLAYDAAGDLHRSSVFATSSGGDVPGPVPFACMACHRDLDGGTGFTLIRP